MLQVARVLVVTMTGAIVLAAVIPVPLIVTPAVIPLTVLVAAMAGPRVISVPS